MADVNKPNFRNHTQVFHDLSNKLACLVYSRTERDKSTLNRLLDDFNSLDFALDCVKTNDQAVLVINQCCYLIPSEDVQLVQKACSLFISLITKQQIAVEGKTLSLAVNWCFECLKHHVSIPLLQVLQALVRTNGAEVEEYCHQFVTKIHEICKKVNLEKDTDQEIYLNCIKCFEAFMYPKTPEPETPSMTSTEQISSILLEILYNERELSDKVIYGRCLISCMKGIGHLVNQCEELLSCKIHEYLGVVKGYMLYGLPAQDVFNIQKVLPSHIAVPELLKPSLNLKKVKGKYDRKSKKKPVASIAEVEDTEVSVPCEEFQRMVVKPWCSDSDFSDGEVGQGAKVRSVQGRVRVCALVLLATVVQRTDPRVFTGYLPSFLPDGSQRTRTLVTSLLKDPSAKSRSEVLAILSTLLSNSKPYLSQANSSSKSSFTSFSNNVGSLIKELHRCMTLALLAENNSMVLTQVLKVISDLLRCSPYHKLEPGLVTKITRHVRAYLKHKDVNVRISALTVFGCVVSVDPKTPEIRAIIVKPREEVPPSPTADELDEDCDNDDDDDSPSVRPWLMERCLRNLMDRSEEEEGFTNVALVIESLQVLGALVRNFFYETVIRYPRDFTDMLKYCSEKQDYPVRLYSGKFMDTMLNSLQASFSAEDESQRASVILSSTIWDAILAGPMVALMSSEKAMLRSTGCDCLANLGVLSATAQPAGLIYELLSRDKQIMCISHLFGSLKDASPAVRAASCRSLAIFIAFQPLREDPLFFQDAADAALLSAGDENPGVRLQAAWLLGNLTGAIGRNKDENIDDGMTDLMTTKLLEHSIRLASDIPKIKPGAVRAVGNLLRIATPKKELTTTGIEIVVRTATTGIFMKARWNACYALANILQNPFIVSNPDWRGRILKSLTGLVEHYKNFKVRISAGCALAVCDRAGYAEDYIPVWAAVLNALENSKNVADFNEYQHRDQLVDQLCLTMCHLVSVVQIADLPALQDLLANQIDTLERSLERLHERIVPEKLSVLLEAAEAVRKLLDERGMSAEQRVAARALERVFCIDSPRHELSRME